MTQIKSISKFNFIYTLLILILVLTSCDDSNNELNSQTTISIVDFTKNINENPIAGLSLGFVEAITNQGTLSYSIITQTPNQALEINASTGEIFVLTASLFDFETYPSITGIVKVDNSSESKTATITINLNDLNDVSDTNNLLAVSDLGEVFQIGNNTGNIVNIGQIGRENNNSILSTNCFVSHQNKIYAVEYVYNPSPTNNLLVFDSENNNSQIIPLNLPISINGDERGIIALTSDNNNLIGVVAENVLINNSPKHIININLQNNSISDLGITFTEDSVSSIIKVNSKLYISTWQEGFLEIDLTNNQITKINAINGGRLAHINNNDFAIMQSVSGFVNGAKPGILNLNSQTISPLENGEIYGLVTVFGKTIIENQIYLNLVSSSSLNLYLGILKTNLLTNEHDIVAINSTTVNRNLIILDITN